MTNRTRRTAMYLDVRVVFGHSLVASMKLAEVPGSVKADEQCAHRKHEYMARGSHVEVSDTQYEHVADDRVEESP